MTQPLSPVTEQLFQSCLSELTEGHLALDRLGAPREVQEGDVIRECLIAERISSVAQRTSIAEFTDAELRSELHRRAQDFLGDPIKGVSFPSTEWPEPIPFPSVEAAKAYVEDSFTRPVGNSTENNEGSAS